MIRQWPKALFLCTLATIGIGITKIGVLDSVDASALQNTTTTLTSLIGCVFAYLVSRRFHPGELPRRIWFLLSLSFALSLGGEFCGLILEVVRGSDMSNVSEADIFWVASYLPYLWGLHMCAQGCSQSAPLSACVPKRFVDTLGILVICVVLAIVILALRTDAESSLLERVVFGAYPVMDALAVWFGLGVLRIILPFFRARIALPWLLMFLSIIVLFIGDLWFLALELQGSYFPTHPVDDLYTLEYTLFGLAALCQLEIVQAPIALGTPASPPALTPRG